MNKLHIVTPGFRPHFIEKILTDLITYPEPFIWHLIMDNNIKLNISSINGYSEIAEKIRLCEIKTAYPYGFEQRRYFTEIISLEYDSNDWVYFLDDDNLVTPYIFDAFHKYKEDPTAKVIMMSKLRYKNSIKKIIGKEGREKAGLVDIGSFISKLEVLKGLMLNTTAYGEDSTLIEYLHATHKPYFKYEENLVTTYNILQL